MVLAVLAIAAVWVPASRATLLPPLPLPSLPSSRDGVLPPLPLPLPTPNPLPLPTGSSKPNPPASSGPPPPPRPSRSPPTRCADQSVEGLIPFSVAVFPCDFPDPMVLRNGGAWYAYASATGWEDDGHAFPVLRSTDLRHWRFVGDAVTAPPGWSNGDLWGPSVLRWQGRYLLFYTALRRAGKLHCLAVASAARPQGPFHTVRRLACQSGHRRGFIDPAPLVAPGRRLYLFFSVDTPRHTISALALSANGVRTIGRLHTVLPVSKRWGRLRSETVEGPWPLHRNGFYYLFYSAGSWSADYRMAYAVSRSPLGPYVDSAPVSILSGTTQLPAPGGGSVLTGHGQSNWLAFAAWSGTPGYGLGSARTMRIAPIHWPRGVPEVVLSGPVGAAAGAASRVTPTRLCRAACS